MMAIDLPRKRFLLYSQGNVSAWSLTLGPSSKWDPVPGYSPPADSGEQTENNQMVKVCSSTLEEKIPIRIRMHCNMTNYKKHGGSANITLWTTNLFIWFLQYKRSVVLLVDPTLILCHSHPLSGSFFLLSLSFCDFAPLPPNSYTGGHIHTMACSMHMQSQQCHLSTATTFSMALMYLSLLL